jgi:hypothetical protein
MVRIAENQRFLDETNYSVRKNSIGDAAGAVKQVEPKDVSDFLVISRTLPKGARLEVRLLSGPPANL